MLKILRVGTVGGDMIDIHLDNDNILMMAIERLFEKPEFEALKEDDRILYPHTDGDKVYWRDGPSLTVAEILSIVQHGNKPK